MRFLSRPLVLTLESALGTLGMFSKEMILTLFASISSSYTHFARPLRRQGHEVPVAIHCLGTSSVGCGRVCTDHGCAGLGPSHPTRRDTAIAAVRVALLPRRLLFTTALRADAAAIIDERRLILVCHSAIAAQAEWTEALGGFFAARAPRSWLAKPRLPRA